MLAKYIFHILNQDPHCHILMDNSYLDDLSEVTHKTQTWQFDDGVVIKRTQEIELDHYDNDAQCPEHWIMWEILDANQSGIFPKRKEFFNLCQQRFWLKMQLANIK